MSALSSLLVRDRVVTVRTIEEALQRQVISGGDLETNLLEMGSIAEDTLAAYRAAVLGGMAATRSEISRVDPAAVSLLPAELATRHRLVPLRREGRRVVVVAAQPLAPETLAEISFLLAADLDVRITTEFRLQWALSERYGAEITPRLLRLAERLEQRDPGAMPRVEPLSHGRIEGPARVDIPWKARPGSGWRDATPTPAKPPTPPPETTGPLVLDTDDRTTTPDLGTVPVVDPRTQAPTPTSAADLGEAVSKHVESAAPPPAPEAAKPEKQNPVAVTRVVAVKPPDRIPVRTGEITAVQIALASAPDRDAVLRVFFEFAKGLFDYAALFVLHDELAEGRDASGPGADREAVSRIAIPLDLPGTLSGVRATGVMYAGRFRSGDADELLLRDLGRTGCDPAALVPVAIKGRVVLLLYGDRAGGEIPEKVARDVAAVANHTAEALTKIILQRKRDSYRPPSGDTDRLALKAAAMRFGSTELPRIDMPPVLPESTVGTDEPDGTPTPQEWAPGPATERREAEAEIQISPLSAEAMEELMAEQGHPTPINPGPVPPMLDGTYRSATGDVRTDVVYSRTPPKAVHPAASERLSEGGYHMGPGRGEPLAVEKVTLPTPRRKSNPPRHPDRIPEEPSVIVDMGANVADLVDQVERGGEEGDLATAALLHVGEAALPELVQRFPGKIPFDRNARHANVPRAKEIGPIPRAIAAFRERAVPYVATLLSHPDADARFYAVLTSADVLHPSLIAPLGERLFDDDVGVRGIAVDVLRVASRHPEHARLLEHIRAIAGDDTGDGARRGAAIRALGELRDSQSVELMIRLLGSAESEIAAAAHRALVVLTRQDFGRNRRRWVSWSERQGSRHRIEWLIDALLHDEPEVRREASDELKRLTQEYFGYHHNLPPRERERAHRRYTVWWQDDGRRRFLPSR